MQTSRELLYNFTQPEDELVEATRGLIYSHNFNEEAWRYQLPYQAGHVVVELAQVRRESVNQAQDREVDIEAA